jgi:hypothetical protein
VQSGAQTLIFPPNFPEAWRVGAGGGGEWTGAVLGEAEGESNSGESWMPGGFDRPRPQQLLAPEADGTAQDHDAPWSSTQRPFDAVELAAVPLGTLHSERDSAFSALTEGATRWRQRDESTEGLLSLLAEQRSVRLLDNGLDQLDSLFAQLGE